MRTIDVVVTPHRGTPIAVIIFVVAIALRLIHLVQLQGSVYADLLVGDAAAYDRWAQQIAGGDWLGRGVFYQAPLYPYLLGLVYTISGHSILTARIIQSIIGAVSCVVLFVAGQRLVSTRVGALAGVLLAVDSSLIFSAALLQKSWLDVLLVCVLLWIIAWLRDVRDAPLRWWLAV